MELNYGVWDDRDDPEGTIFADGVIDVEKSCSIMTTQKERGQVRRERLEFVIQLNE